jgi:glycosyltransferase involved in cell wall biosynthesis
MLTQSMPALGGHGTSIRAGLTLQALAHRFDVTLLLVSELRHVQEAALTPDLAAFCSELITVPVPPADESAPRSLFSPRSLDWNGPALQQALATLRGRRFDHVHVQRLRLLPVWQLLQGLQVSAAWRVLDLDDIESRTAARQLRQSWRQLGWATSAQALAEVLRLHRAESTAARQMDRVIVCSEADRQTLARRMPRKVPAVVPNSAPCPEPMPERDAGNDGTLQLLFVGSLFYQPNLDAVRWLLDELMPHLAQHPQLHCQLSIVGRRPPAWLLARHVPPAVQVHGDAPDLLPLYREADIVLAPIRSGGGTRIKIIEALAYGRPVVSTAIGAEGLDVEDGQHLLLAESADDFGRQIERLGRDPALRQRLQAAGRSRVDELYSPAAFTRRLLAVHTNPEPAS